ncbi:MAG: hypothetical protein IPH10_08565 [bacterium]|nr:hypothetical protein [bacterium]
MKGKYVRRHVVLIFTPSVKPNDWPVPPKPGAIPNPIVKRRCPGRLQVAIHTQCGRTPGPVALVGVARPIVCKNVTESRTPFASVTTSCIGTCMLLVHG